MEEMTPKDEKLRANIKELMERAKASAADYSNQVVTQYPDGFVMISPGPGPRKFKKHKPIDVPGDSWADELVRNRR
jgi:hypothetical protein